MTQSHRVIEAISFVPRVNPQLSRGFIPADRARVIKGFQPLKYAFISSLASHTISSTAT